MLASFLDYTFSIAVTRITCATLGYVMPEFSPQLATSRVSRSPCYHTPSLSLLPAQARWLFLQIWHRPSKWDGIAVSPRSFFIITHPAALYAVAMRIGTFIPRGAMSTYCNSTGGTNTPAI